MKPEAFNAIRDWNKTQPIPVEVINIWGLLELFDKYNLKASDTEDLLRVAECLSI